MGLVLKYQKHTLRFKFAAGTSRGILKEKDSWIIKLYNRDDPDRFGLGECGPLPNLSIDDITSMENMLDLLSTDLRGTDPPTNEADCLAKAGQLVPNNYPSIRFALETAFLDLLNGGRRIIFNNPFNHGDRAIPINGLVWMGDKDFMHEQITRKIGEGFSCIKMKIGAIDFEEEVSLLKYIRKNFPDKDLTLRVDANGAFSPEEAMDKLSILATLNIHSIEQPIAAGQLQSMAHLCRESPIPIALDEELIGLADRVEQQEMLEIIRPAYVILKPTLLGGLNAGRNLISLAEKLGIGWWMTSALESNIGLNAIAQFTAQYPLTIPQGLGTGGLYLNNIDSPLTIKKGMLQSDQANSWDYSQLGNFI